MDTRGDTDAFFNGFGLDCGVNVWSLWTRFFRAFSVTCFGCFFAWFWAQWSVDVCWMLGSCLVTCWLLFLVFGFRDFNDPSAAIASVLRVGGGELWYFFESFSDTVSGRRFSHLLVDFWTLWGSILGVWGHLWGHMFSDDFLMDFGVPAPPPPPKAYAGEGPRACV